ncbi:hypothetical protein JM946_07020 [Steroidobacter sp. S1-65]|uniref:Peptidase M12B domain-containing protein n=1 Tax=Steroidobacter gossypii TaxID=2805490 RepID=A0ABS1WU37_9GAMM|nr:M12 family metallo-peptidase [Steroidobacter gossypii]MBM0104491.1 hypothetical protein [Steroidobacter gossypii]
MIGGDRRDSATKFGQPWHWLAAFALGTVTGVALGAEQDDTRILYFEPLRLATPTGQVQRKSSQTHALQFDAYGRRFDLTLEPNERLSPLLTDQPNIELYRGHINGETQSWVRLSITQGQLAGMIWDGAELYVIEPAAELRASLPVNAKVAADTTAIFRLKDVEMAPGSASCGVDTTAIAGNGSDAYRSMVSELKGAPAIMQAAGATRRIELSVLADNLLRNQFTSESQTREQILQRLNNVDGIYSSQLGVQISVPSIDIGDSLSATTAPSSLLSELADLRRRSPNLNARGLTHLFTGRNLDGSTVGIAYISSVCDRQYGAGLTEASGRNAWMESLIAAHEIGHNFGAPHDGDVDGACASTPTGVFLMSSSINGNDRFSSCSLSIMQPKANNASCITALANADITVDSSLGSARRPLGRNFDWALTVRNAGGLATTDARAEITLPSELTIVEAFVSGGTCTSGGGRVNCELGNIAGGNSTAVQLSLRGALVGSYPIAVDVSAANEGNLANNHGEGTIQIETEVDLGVSLQAPSSVAANEPFSASFSARNESERSAGSVTLTMALPSGVSASSATLAGGSCSVASGTVTCSLPSLASGASAAGTVSLTAGAIGSVGLQAHVSSSHLDPDTANDRASTTVNVTAAAVTNSSSGSSGGGGGGSLGTGLLALLLGTLGLKSLQQRRRHTRPADA